MFFKLFFISLTKTIFIFSDATLSLRSFMYFYFCIKELSRTTVRTTLESITIFFYITHALEY